MEKRIVIIGAGELQVPIIRTAKEMGIYTIVVDRDPNAPGFAHADLRVQADTMNPEEVLIALEPYGVPNGALTAGTDASLTVAKIAEKYHLVGHTVAAAEACTDKAKMRQLLAKEGVSVPDFFPVSTIEQAEEAFRKLGGVAVVKPSGNMGARGVSLVSNEFQLTDAFNLAWEHASKTKQVLIEEYKEGKEISVDALILNNTITITGVADRIIELSPYFVETGHILPSSLPKETIEEALLLFRDAVKALGLTAGAAKGDIKITENGPVIIEVAARLSGGFMSAYTFPLATGIDLNQWMIKLALAEPLPLLKPTMNKVAVERAIIAPAGKIRSIFVPEGLDVAHISIRKKIGDTMPQPKNNLDKIGNVIVVGSSRKDALQKANKVLRNIKILVDSEGEQASSCPADGLSVLPKYRLVPQYIHHVRQGNTACDLLGIHCRLPVFPSITTDLMSVEQANSILKGSFYAGTFGLVSGSLSNDLILQNFGHGVALGTPSAESANMYKQLEKAMELGALGVGIDLGSVDIRGHEHYSAQNDNDLKGLSVISPNFFVVKGVLSVTDALLAVKSGATHLIVASRREGAGFFASAIDVLASIREAVQSKVSILIEIPSPSPADMIKCFILGADGIVLPHGVVPSSSPQEAYLYLNRLQNQLEKHLPILGVNNVSVLKGKKELLLSIQ
ncbi:MAG: alpha-hydroxy-acid oxidizing protein [Brevinema sp.]